MYDLSESQVDPFPSRALPFRHRVLPVPLAIAGHHEDVTIAQAHDFLPAWISIIPQDEVARRTEGNGSCITTMILVLFIVLREHLLRRICFPSSVGIQKGLPMVGVGP